MTQRRQRIWACGSHRRNLTCDSPERRSRRPLLQRGHAEKHSSAPELKNKGGANRADYRAPKTRDRMRPWLIEYTPGKTAGHIVTPLLRGQKQRDLTIVDC
ncbi:hypothetical protein NDU88_003769 [Pleurodeles waltl]|uniref:Uncharacterized protein n=1 Tax=Pleurodeles waltl TaxID=8319 RepID=A0AAV7QFU4_PLEWA|nr:hypothetical protein NDU88_003769 [Pleurodeles waltl]